MALKSTHHHMQGGAAHRGAPSYWPPPLESKGSCKPMTVLVLGWLFIALSFKYWTISCPSKPNVLATSAVAFVLARGHREVRITGDGLGTLNTEEKNGPRLKPMVH